MHRDFDASNRAAVREPVTFTLKGRDFEALPDAPGRALFDAVRAMTGTEVEVLDGTMAFLDAVLTDESARRFIEAFESKTEPITLGDTVDLVEWLIADVYGGGAPKAGSSPSSDGRSTTGGSSTGSTPAEASTSSPSRRLAS